MKKLSVLFICLCMIAGLMTTSCERQDRSDVIAINFFSGTPGGTWYPLAVALAEIWQREITEYRLDFLHADAGGSGNLVAIQNGIAQVAVSTSTSIGDGLIGNDPFTERTTRVYGLAALNPEPFGLFVWADSGIYTLHDMRGRRIAPMPRGNTTEAIVRRVLTAIGMTYDDFTRVEFVHRTEALNQMRDGHIDIHGMTFAKSGDASVMELTMSRPIRVLDIPPDIQARIGEISPGIFPDVLPAGAYRGVYQDVNLIGQTLALAVCATLPESLVYLMTKTMVANWAEMQAVSAAMARLEPRDLANDVLGTDFHPGALRYFQGRGWL